MGSQRGAEQAAQLGEQRWLEEDPVDTRIALPVYSLFESHHHAPRATLDAHPSLVLRVLPSIKNSFVVDLQLADEPRG